MVKKKKLPKNKAKSRRTKRRPRFDIHSDTLKSLWGIIFLIFFFLSLLSLVGMAGDAGQLFSGLGNKIFGWGIFMVPPILLISSYILFNSWQRNTYLPIFIGGFLFFSGILGMFSIVSSPDAMWGGYWGHIIVLPFIKLFGKLASIIIFLGFILGAIVVSFNIKIGKIIKDRSDQLKELKFLKSQVAGREASGGASLANFKVKTWNEEGDESEKDLAPLSDSGDEVLSSKEAAAYEKEEKEGIDEVVSNKFEPKITPAVSDFKLPLGELLEKETGRPSSGDIVANANIIKRTFQNFGIEVEMGEVNVGPTVTQFTLKPAEGVKLSSIMALNNDLSLALAAHPIRIEAPIPGRSLVGIEIPNKGFTIVRLKNLIESQDFKRRDNNLTLCLGRDVSGKAIYANLAKMPHLLIAGSTGSGKTICLNIVILSLLYQNPPDLLKFILIDPKRVEFPVYSDIPHLLAPIVVDTQKAVGALKWAVSEMERRFDLLSRVRQRDIGGFNSNKKAVAEHGPLPYIVIIIDEMADLMASRGKEFEALIVRLAQMSRAVGIHLILATQRPSVEVITGLIKANITARIVFQVASQVDSRTVLDMAGAEKLLGNGDMLYLSGDASRPKRVQGAYIMEKEVRRVADYLREEGEKLGARDEGEETIDFQGAQNVSQTVQSGVDSHFDFDEVDVESDDDLYDEAKKVVIQAQKASSSLLQRRLRVGYARAARLVDMLEEEGVVGPGEGAKPRDVYIGRDEEEV